MRAEFSKTVEELDVAFFATVFGDVGREVPHFGVSNYLALTYLVVPLSRLVGEGELAASQLNLSLRTEPTLRIMIGDTITAVAETGPAGSVTVTVIRNHAEELAHGQVTLDPIGEP
ncbi:hypothetical protein [Acrocarpospora catenulata]|uniref:hypothetical protein n=1 Tax=Acrocarpospora catenulata TaxID=2836182 RepID=UPI001BDA1BFC|nr:hypothetical protein [Acrocarpospora catenulata]